MKQPYEMAKEQFNQAFPLFTELSPRAKWRCFRINNSTNLRETGEEITWQEFVEFATSYPYRWCTDDMSLLIDDSHEYFIQQALLQGEDIPSDVLAEYPDLVEEYIGKRAKLRREQQARASKRLEERFWKSFQ